MHQDPKEESPDFYILRPENIPGNEGRARVIIERNRKPFANIEGKVSHTIEMSVGEKYVLPIDVLNQAKTTKLSLHLGYQLVDFQRDMNGRFNSLPKKDAPLHLEIKKNALYITANSPCDLKIQIVADDELVKQLTGDPYEDQPLVVHIIVKEDGKIEHSEP